MRQTKILMGMLITVEILGVRNKDIHKKVFECFEYVDNKFSTYKENSEISKINRGEIKKGKYSLDMKKIFKLSQKTKKESNGYFNIVRSDRKIDPSGVVKGWAIHEAANIIRLSGFSNFYISAGGDIEASGENSKGKPWSIGIKNPFKPSEIVKVVSVRSGGVATSGNYERGLHIYNPKTGRPADEVASITVIGPDILEADRFATAAFAMGSKGIKFIEKRQNLEGYMIDKKGIATYTSGFEKYVA